MSIKQALKLTISLGKPHNLLNKILPHDIEVMASCPFYPLLSPGQSRLRSHVMIQGHIHLPYQVHHHLHWK